ALTKTLLEEDLLRIWETDHKTVVFVTHDMAEATFLSDRIVVMGTRPGRIIDIVEVDLPRPRNEGTRTLARAAEIEHHVWGELQKVLLSDENGPARSAVPRGSSVG